MGGSAFSSGENPLFTPRMAPTVYREVRDRCQAILREIFLCVASPIEGPAKEDYGDVDILVSLQKHLIFPTTPADRVECEGRDILAVVQKMLGAEHMIIERGGNAANLAIPWPADLITTTDNPEATRTNATLNTDQDQEQQESQVQADQQNKKRHIQVDVQICASPSQLQWELFKHAHGDLWNLVGSTIRPLGLTVDEEALWIRIPEIEAFHRSRSKVRLTDDPAAVLSFLGLRADGSFWEAPFGSLTELFEYIASCRWFWVAPEKAGVEEDGSGSTGADSTVDKKKYKANDRRRMKFRPIYRIWVEEFLPRCRAKGLFRPPLPPSPAEPDAATTSTTTTSEHARLLVRDEAFARFPGAGAEYAVRLHEWRAERQRDEILRSVIKGEIPSSSASDPAYRACLVRALREILLPGEQQQGQSRKQHASLGPEAVAALAPARPIRGADGLYDVDAAREFVRDRWEEVGKVAWEAQLARASGQPWGVKLEVEDILEEKVEDKLEEKVEEKGGEKVGEKVGEKEGEE